MYVLKAQPAVFTSVPSRNGVGALGLKKNVNTDRRAGRCTHTRQALIVRQMPYQRSEGMRIRACFVQEKACKAPLLCERGFLATLPGVCRQHCPHDDTLSLLLLHAANGSRLPPPATRPNPTKLAPKTKTQRKLARKRT